MSEMTAVPGKTLCVVTLTYSDQAGAQAIMDRHMTWLQSGYERGAFLASGRKDPWTGGILIAVGDRATVEAAMADAPFVTSGIATVDIAPFVLGLAAKPLADLLA